MEPFHCQALEVIQRLWNQSSFLADVAGTVQHYSYLLTTATTPGDFEDYARRMYHKYKALDVPTWIIGPPVGELAESRTPTQVMKVWPSRDDIVTTTADEFNAELDALLDKHCSYV